MIGSFVIVSLVLFMAAIVIFSGAKFFSVENLVITYFEGSLQGLSVGAPVTYRGVTVGQVKEIKIHIQANENKNQELIIPVLISLNAGETLIVDGTDTYDETNVNDFLQDMCEQGLRAKLKLQSLVTGKRYIDLAFYENSPAVFRDQAGKYFEIPTLPSEIQQLTKMLENIDLGDAYNKVISTLDSIEKLTTNISKTLSTPTTKALVTNLSSAASSLDSILSQVDSELSPILEKVDGGLDNINGLTNHADQMVTSLDTRIKPVVDEMTNALASIDTTLQQADDFFAQAEETIQPDSPLYYRLTEAMHQLEKTGKSMERLSNFIHRNPDTLIFGLQKTEKSQQK